MDKIVEYSSDGFVWGNLWDYSQGGYEAKRLTASSMKEIVDKAKAMLQDGSLDGGMGYESLIGAVLLITKTEKITINKKVFTHESYQFRIIGKLSPKIVRHLKNAFLL